MTRFKVLMEYSFHSTNTLMSLLSKHLKQNPTFQHIAVDTKVTIGENADKLAKGIEQVKCFINDIDKKLANHLEPTLYSRLTSPDTTFKQKLNIVEESMDTLSNIDETVAGLTIVGAIKAWSALLQMIEVLKVIKTCSLAGIALGVHTQGCDRACHDEEQQASLKNMMMQFQKELSQFEPVSRKYTKAATSVDLNLQIALKN